MGMGRCVQLPVAGTGDSGSRRNDGKGDLVASAAGSRPVGGAGITVPGADRLVWYFMRLSGALLIILAGGHILITHYSERSVGDDLRLRHRSLVQSLLADI